MLCQGRGILGDDHFLRDGGVSRVLVCVDWEEVSCFCGRTLGYEDLKDTVCYWVDS